MPDKVVSSEAQVKLKLEDEIGLSDEADFPPSLQAQSQGGKWTDVVSGKSKKKSKSSNKSIGSESGKSESTQGSRLSRKKREGRARKSKKSWASMCDEGSDPSSSGSSSSSSSSTSSGSSDSTAYDQNVGAALSMAQARKNIREARKEQFKGVQMPKLDHDKLSYQEWLPRAKAFASARMFPGGLSKSKYLPKSETAIIDDRNPTIWLRFECCWNCIFAASFDKER